MKKVLGLLMGGVVLAVAVQSCSTDPALYLGGPAGPIAALTVSNSRVDFRVGSTVTIGARGVDAVGNTTADTPTFSSCDGSVVSVATATPLAEFSAGASLTAVGMGASCVTVSAGSFTENVAVTAGPTALKIVGDPIIGYDSQDSTVNVFEFMLAPVDGSGNPLTGTVSYEWASSVPAVAFAEFETGVVRTYGLGSVRISVRAPGGANDVLAVTVGAPAFDGTSSASTGGQGDLVSLTRTGGPELDANTTAYVDFGGTRAFIDGAITASALRVAIPATGKLAARSDIVLRKVGPADVDRRVPFTMTTSGTGHKYSPASDACGTAPNFDAAKSAANWVYFTFKDATAGYAGADPDIWFTVPASASDRTVDVRLEWMSPNGGSPYADADLFVHLDCGATLDASQQYNPPDPPVEELTGIVVPAGQTLNVRAVVYDAQGAAFSNARIRVQ